MNVDAMIGQVLATLDKLKLRENTLVLFSSDNGPVWYRQDIEKFEHRSAGPWNGMKGALTEAGHRMPFIVRWPAVAKAGTVSEQTISFTDLLATCADAVNRKLPAGAGPDSYSFLPVLRGGTIARPPIVMESGSGLMSIRSGPWKLIEGLGSGGFSKPSKVKAGPDDPAGQLYHLGEDRAETTNRFSEQPEVVARLRAEMRKIVGR
jgi:arylsulfatase A-like enzyme